MKVPELAAVEPSGMHDWKGSPDPLKSGASHAGLGFALVDLSKARDKAGLFGELDRALALPEHFGHNFDALADVLEDRDWLGKKGRVVVLAHAAGWRREHPNDWSTLEDVLRETSEFW